MKRRLVIDVDCGERTCSPGKGKFCDHLRTARFGTIFYCRIWHEKSAAGVPVPIREENGWCMRRPECLEAELGHPVEESPADEGGGKRHAVPTL